MMIRVVKAAPQKIDGHKNLDQTILKGVELKVEDFHRTQSSNLF